MANPELDNYVESKEAAALKRLRAAAAALVAKHDEYGPELTKFMQFAAIHGMPWTKGNWKDELEELRAAVEASKT